MEINTVTISTDEYKRLVQKAYEYDCKYTHLSNEFKSRKDANYESKIDSLNAEIDRLRLQIEEERIKSAAFVQYSKPKKKHWWQWRNQ